MAGGSGWVLLTYVPRDGRLINQIASEHDQCIAGGMPVLALDMYEHAYHLEFGANANAYIAAFMRNIDRRASYCQPTGWWCLRWPKFLERSHICGS
jgi:Fe-Mn family superoxide dismutase